MPLVSFVVPVHNAALTLPRCLNSLLAQTEKTGKPSVSMMLRMIAAGKFCKSLPPGMPASKF